MSGVAAPAFQHQVQHGVGRRVEVLGVGGQLVGPEQHVVEHLHLVGGVHAGAHLGPGLKAQLFNGAIQGLQVGVGILIGVQQPHAFEQVVGARLAPGAQALLQAHQLQVVD